MERSVPSAPSHGLLHGAHLAPSTLPSPPPRLSLLPMGTSSTSRAVQQRQEKVAMWSAVALQQHFTLSGGAAALSHAPPPTTSAPLATGTHRHAAAAAAAVPTCALPRPLYNPRKLEYNTGTRRQRHHRQMSGATDASPRLTLAQKMNLVPAPPASPSPDDWHAIETRAMLRQQQAYQDARRAAAQAVATRTRAPSAEINQTGVGVAATPEPTNFFALQQCSICHDAFCYTAASDTLAGRHQGMVILSCSHVFHERCFRQFERLVRRQQWEELHSPDAALTGLMTRLACPECRSTSYHKKTYFAGGAMAQRAALVRIQAVVRGFLARRQYCSMKLRTNAPFREVYVQSRLARLAEAWQRYLDKESRRQKALLSALDVQREEAAAAFLSERDWQALMDRRLSREEGADSCVTQAARTKEGNQCADGEGVSGCACAICLEHVQKGLRPSQAFFLPSCAPREATKTPICDRQVPTAAAQGNAEGSNVPVKPTRSKQGVSTVYRAHRTKINRSPSDRGQATSQSGSTRPKDITSACASTCGTTAAGHVCDAAKAPDALGTNNAQRGSTVNEVIQNASSPAPRYGVILSCCGNVFHEACLAAWERYMTPVASHTSHSNGGRVDPLPLPPPRRCPLCRHGYGKHSF